MHELFSPQISIIDINPLNILNNFYITVMKCYLHVFIIIPASRSKSLARSNFKLDCSFSKVA